MSAPEFTPTDRATWAEVLTAPEVAAIFRRKVGGLKKACQRTSRHPFVPVPYQSRPFLWRRADVIRALDSGRVQIRMAS